MIMIMLWVTEILFDFVILALFVLQCNYVFTESNSEAKTSESLLTTNLYTSDARLIENFGMSINRLIGGN